MKKILFLFIILSSSARAQQDKHFSMYFANLVQFNPAAAGHHSGDIQLFTNFRSQWFLIPGKSFRTISASIDGRFFEKSLGNDFIGIGTNFYNDVSGDGAYSLNVISLPINYSLATSRTSRISMGVQAGAYMQNINGQLYFQNQWDGTSFNQNLPTGESLNQFSETKFDLSAGIHFVSAPTNNKKIEIGLSGQHLLKQNISVIGDNNQLYRNFTMYAKADLGNSFKDWSYHPAIIGMMHGPNWEITTGCNFSYIIKPASKHTMYFDGQSISFGFYHRVLDAFIGNIIYTAGAFSLGASYDLNVSGLIPASKGVGAVEVFLRYAPNLGYGKFGAPRIH